MQRRFSQLLCEKDYTFKSDFHSIKVKFNQNDLCCLEKFTRSAYEMNPVLGVSYILPSEVGKPVLRKFMV